MYEVLFRRYVALTIDQIIIGTVAFLILPKEIYNYNFTYILITQLVLITILNWIYCCSMESSKYQATIGKRLLGVMVVDKDDERITYVRANSRYWWKLLSGLILCFGYLMAFSHEKRQALHDRMTGTYVVNKSFLLFMLNCQKDDDVKTDIAHA
ncbi:RDD family protein [Paenibacillus fonticola]|uniref:RDD family protein n=1 Tax=Paenibacillus fonticola TaxID=379896 RepID=UPI0006873C6B|nr:RDD family protein [Paenibacillus fonticola]